jgi:hypothetical protein
VVDVVLVVVFVQALFTAVIPLVGHMTSLRLYYPTTSYKVKDSNGDSTPLSSQELS